MVLPPEEDEKKAEPSHLALYPVHWDATGRNHRGRKDRPAQEGVLFSSAKRIP